VNYKRTLATLESGRVSRYHAAPTVQAQTVGLHAWGVAVLVLELSDNCSKELLQAAILHDSAELYTGDVPFTLKVSEPAVKGLLHEAEVFAHSNIVLDMPLLSESEWAILKLADTIEGLIWCRKTEAEGGCVGPRWMGALKAGFTKFSEVLPPHIIERANLIASKNNLYTFF
jgi:5'-deoxynucleotidase YfbR-like HD superfamily hydrolase